MPSSSWAKLIEQAGADARAQMGFGPFCVDPSGKLVLPIELLTRSPKPGIDVPQPWPMEPAPGWLTRPIDDEWSVMAWCAVGGQWAFEPLSPAVKRKVFLPERVSGEYAELIRSHLHSPLQLISTGLAFAFCDSLFVLPETQYLMNSFQYDVQQENRDPLGLFVGYRGHAQPYPEVVTPSIFRAHSDPTDDSSLRYQQRARVATNIVKQLMFEAENIALTDVQARGVLQHYGIIGPTDVLDLSYDVNVAKWFSLNVWNREMGKYEPKRFQHYDDPGEAHDECSIVYTIAVRVCATPLAPNLMRKFCQMTKVSLMPWQMPIAPSGTSMMACPPRNISPLWSQRPSRQSGFGLHGIHPTENDTLGSILSVVEHRFHPTFAPNGWDRIGGAQLFLDGKRYSYDDDTSHLEDFLLPQDSDVISKMRMIVTEVFDDFGLNEEA